MKRWWLSLFIVVPSLIFMSMERGAVPRDSFAQTKEMTLLRNIGHQVLLSSGDSSARVLPIEKRSEGVFVIRFERTFSPVPDTLVGLFAKHLSGIAEYSVEIKNCQENELLYSFIISRDNSNSIIPCLGRNLPTGCYEIVVQFPQPSSRVIYYLAGIILVLVLTGSWLVYKKSKEEKIIPPVVDPEPQEEVMPGFISIGRFHFHPSRQKLELDTNIIELTGKESQLLAILAQSPNEVVDRERLQKEVWEDEGVIVTRSLDMFISKLRKKLKDDPSVSIANVHGKGYRLEVI